MDFSYLEFFLGLGAGLIGFLLQDRISHLIAGRRFRQRIACDIQIIARNHLEHLPQLKKRIEDVGQLVEGGEIPGDIRAYPVIWSNEFSLLPHLLENSAHLRIDVFNACVEFYDVMGRLEEVRRAHNDSARHLATSREDRLAHLQFLHYCLKRQRLDYLRALQQGGHALCTLSREYRHVEVDRVLLASISECGAPAGSPPASRQTSLTPSATASPLAVAAPRRPV